MPNDWWLWAILLVSLAVAIIMWPDHDETLEEAFERARRAPPEGPSPIRLLDGIDLPLGPRYDFDAMSLSRNVHHKMPEGFIHTVFGPVERCACNRGKRVP